MIVFVRFFFSFKDFTKISSNLRNHPEYNTLAIKCIQLYHPETLFVEYNQDYSEYDIKQLFKNKGVFHIKTYSSCAFVHFYSHEGKFTDNNRHLLFAY